MRARAWFATTALSLSVALSVALSIEDVRAQTAGGIALDPLDPAPPGDDFFSVPSPHALGSPLDGRAAVLLSYARDPLRLVGEAGDPPLVSHQALVHVGAAMALFDRGLVSLDLPLAISQAGDDPTVQGVSVASPAGAAVGDLRAGVRVRVFGEPRTPFQIGTGLDLYFPSGDEQAYVGEGVVRETLYLSLGGSFEAGVSWLYTAAIGVHIRPSTNPSLLRYGGGVAVMLFDGVWQLGPEIYAATPLQSGSFLLDEGARLDTDDGSNVELLFGSRVRLARFELGAAGGPGLSRAVGTPSYRLLASAGMRFGPEVVAPPPDADQDGVPDATDACVYAHGPESRDARRRGCPVLDDDDDGVPNHEDACPAAFGLARTERVRNGCP